MNDNQQSQLEFHIMTSTNAEILHLPPQTISEYDDSKKYLEIKIDGERTTAYRTSAMRILSLIINDELNLTPGMKQIALTFLRQFPDLVPEVRRLKPEILDN